MTFKRWVQALRGRTDVPASRSQRLSLQRLDERITPDAAPVLAGGTASQTIPLAGPAVFVDPLLNLTDADNTNLLQASVTIAGNFTAGDVLTVTPQGGISASYSGGVLTLTGSASPAAYQTTLRSVKYQGTAAGGGARSIRFSIAPANYYADTTAAYFAGQGHLYEYVTEFQTWSAVRTSSTTRNLYGRNGYLATLTSSGESQFATDIGAGRAGWIGGSDAAAEGDWRWVTGPEGQTNGGAGLQFWSGGPASAGGFVTNGLYANWSSGEPNNTTFTFFGVPFDEDFATINTAGVWNDLGAVDTTLNAVAQAGYYAEYGGQGEAALQLFATTTISLQTAAPSVTTPATAVTVGTPTATVAGAATANSLVRVYRDANANNVVDAGDTVVASQQLTGGAIAYSIAAPLTTNAANNLLVTAQLANTVESAAADVPVVTQDATPPAISVTSPTSAAATKNTSFTIAGTAEANALVQIFADLNGNGVLNANEMTPVASQQLTGGATGYSLATPLTANAVNFFLVTATDPYGNKSAPVVVPAITQDSLPPTITLTSPTGPAATANSTFTLAGTTEANALVQIYRDANGNGAIDPGETVPVATQQLTGGATSFSRAVNLNAGGANFFLVTAVDAVGNESAPAAVPAITQDATPPTLTITAPTAASATSATTVTITGTTEANALVRVYRDANFNNVIDAAESTPVAQQQLAGGATAFNVVTPLNTNAANAFLVTAVDLAGNLSPVAAVPTIVQDSVPPAISLTAPTAAQTTANATVTIAGTTEANALVRVYKDANNNNVIDPSEATPVAQQQLTGGATAYSVLVNLDPNAANNFLVTATDAAGNQSAPVNVPTITQDTLPPDAPTVTTPAAATPTRGATATVAGTAEAGALVRVYRDLNNNNTIDLADPVVAQQQLAGGATGFSITVALNADAANNFLVTAADAAGNQSAPADVPTITQDSIPPGAPAVLTPSAPTFTAATKSSVAGQAEANALVQVYQDVNNNGAIDKGIDAVVASQQLTAGATTFSVLTPLTANAANNFLVTAVDAAGNESGPSDVPTIFQDALPPAAPVIANPTTPTTVNAASVTIAGTVEANALVKVYRDANNNNVVDAGDTVATVAQLAGGATAFFISVALTQNAANNFVVTAIDAAGNESAAADVPTVTEDSTPPGAPGVTFPAAPTAVNADAVTVAGAAEANALVRVYRDANNNNAIDAGELVVATQQLTGGATAYSIAAPLLQNAANNFLVTAVDAAGNESGPADVPTVTEDSVAPNAPGVTTPAAAVATRSATATVAGTAEANALVRVYRDANNNGIADPGELLVTQQLTGGATAYTILVSLVGNAANNFLATAVDAAGNESNPADVPTITQDSIPPATPAVVDPPGPMTANAPSYTVRGTAEANAQVKVYRDANNNNTFDPGETVVATQQLTGGATAFAVAAPLAQDAANNFLVTATDPAGNESLPADVPTVTEDSTPPAAPVVTAPAAAVTLRGTTVTIEGTSEANALVKVYRDLNNNNAADPGEPAVAQVQLTGGATTFSLVVSLNQNAANTFVVTASDRVGNESAAADVPTVTDDSAPPTGTTVTAPAGGTTVNADTFTVTGTAEANALVRLYRDRNNNGVIDGGDVVLGQQQLAGGATAFAIPTALAQDATNDFLVTAADAVGNESAPVDVPTITEDSSPPAGPAVTVPAGVVTVPTGPFTVRGSAEANALVRLFPDANNDNVPDDPTKPVASVQLTDGATKFALSAPLTANAANNFVVVVTDAVGNPSPPADVPTVFADAVGPTGPAVQQFALAGAPRPAPWSARSRPRPRPAGR